MQDGSHLCLSRQVVGCRVRGQRAGGWCVVGCVGDGCHTSELVSWCGHSISCGLQFLDGLAVDLCGCAMIGHPPLRGCVMIGQSVHRSPQVHRCAQVRPQVGWEACAALWTGMQQMPHAGKQIVFVAHRIFFAGLKVARDDSAGLRVIALVLRWKR